ncbi:MAG: hypothetical protein COC19_03730 [SAR86 cluster bacterium]|uniref:Uncharacterized protein n=1 Tax=SAR86 cluster bacterium TaxID=2030880 RepID=A0A2A4MPU1_9GAMM|nr:MAG: hypothetical protein COC19_03730 [SAR86 cluster bacterium]
MLNIARLSCSLLLGIFCTTAIATTLLEIDVDAMSQDAEFIFEGEVILIESQQNNGSIRSHVSFRVLDIIKGSFSGEIIELAFTGGSIGERTVSLSESDIPQLDEVGIYFVESTSRQLLNPLLGWSQGHFIIDTDKLGTRRIHSNKMLPVSAIQSTAAIPRNIRKPKSTLAQNQSALGIITETETSAIEQAMTVEQFKMQIRELFE